MTQAAFVHTVHFWLKPDLSDEQRADVMAGIKSLADSPNVSTLRVGVPAGTPREVVDNSYDIQLMVTFADSESHDRYQSDSDVAHQAFIDGYKQYWTRVLIYDSLEA